MFKELNVMNICMYSYDSTNVKDVCKELDRFLTEVHTIA